MENSQRKYAVLSLDPMYSPLHSKIAAQVGKQQECYAILSCWAKKVYLRGFQCTLATKLINSVNESSLSNTLLKRVEQLTTYHHAYVKKVEKRALSQTEIRYMARFYQALEQYIDSKRIELILVHNDLRWYHAIAIDICKRKGIRYLVTEQGLIRPYTTVIDNQGVNANANLDFPVRHSNKPIVDRDDFQPTSYHDSWLSIAFFALFLSVFTCERLAGNSSILRYMHNNYSLSKYVKRIFHKLHKPSGADNLEPLFGSRYILLLLQLETDSQILVHSPFSSNQEIILRVEQQAMLLGCRLAIKRHPLDRQRYHSGEQTVWVNGLIEPLAKHAQCVVSVNSSSVISVLKTGTPLFLLGDSLCAYPSVAESIVVDELAIRFSQVNTNKKAHIENRSAYLQHLQYYYLMKGAGWSFSPKLLEKKLQQLL